MEIEIRTIEPVEAARILHAQNSHNRDITTNRVRKYADAMLAGEWTSNGDPLRFDTDGNLIDGQHRLSAVVLASRAQEFVIIGGVHHNAIYTIDTGKARNAGDVLSIDAEVPKGKAQTYAAALKLFGFYRARGVFPTGGAQAQSNAEVSRLYQENQELVTVTHDWMVEAIKGQVQLMPKGRVLALAMIFSGICEADAQDFLVPVLTGEGLVAGSTQKHLRDLLLKLKAGTLNYKPVVVLNTVVKCWNSYRSGSNIAVSHNIVWRANAAASPVAK